jgi:hypothetical protein
MIRIHRIAAGLVAMVAGAVALCAASSAAFAETVAPPAGPDNVGHQLTPAQTVLIGGMPGWQIALIAVAAALVAGVAAVLVDRARSARRQLAPAS